MALTDTQLRNAKPKEKDYSISDSLGLSILITAKGGKWWRFRYRHLGKPKLMSLGTYPEVALLQARSKRDEARALVADDKDPSEVRKQKNADDKLNSENTFHAVADAWHLLHNKNKSERHKQRVRRWLDVYLFPSLGAKPISKITAPKVLEATSILQKQGKLETAHRVIQVAGQVFRYAIQKGFATNNPTPDLKGALPAPTIVLSP